MGYDEFLQDVCPRLNLVWRKYRRRAARHRVEERMSRLGLKNFQDYMEILRIDQQEMALLPDLMRITVTRFFRDQQQWRELQERILPGLVSGNAGTLRIWSAGCCGGEEPYSLALLWLAHLQPLYPCSSIEIVATDIDDASLERARCARYRTETLREVPAGIRRRWFSKEKGEWHLDERVTSLVRLEKRNLVTDAPPDRMDLVLCRYLAFTYYKGPRVCLAAERLWESLRPGGILMIGAKEDFPAEGLEYFEPLPESRVFYRRKG